MSNEDLRANLFQINGILDILSQLKKQNTELISELIKVRDTTDDLYSAGYFEGYLEGMKVADEHLQLLSEMCVDFKETIVNELASRML